VREIAHQPRAPCERSPQARVYRVSKKVTLSPAYNGMAASDLDDPERPLEGAIDYLSGSALGDRLEEEINRAGRHGTPLCCLLLNIEDLHGLRRAHGQELGEQVLAYVELALRRELRRFDRVGRRAASELLVVLPGADGPRGEVVARRALTRLRAIKFEADGARRPLRVTVGLVLWREGMSAGALVNELRSTSACAAPSTAQPSITA
jgi:diguanylate cyclase (GGDEF)-like protein